MDDAELYARWRGGDTAAAKGLVERHYDSITRFFRTKVGPQRCDDLVQRTFLAAAEGNYRGESSFRAYLFGIARNVLLDHFRLSRRDAKNEPDFNESSVHQLAPGISTAAVARAEQRVLVGQLQRLPVEIQMTLELFYWEDLSVEELAEVLSIPPGTVKSRLHRGRTMLKEAMQKSTLPPDEKESVRALIDGWADQMRARLGDLDGYGAR